MQLNMLKAKIHRATVTQAELDYEGSCAVDEQLLKAAGIREFEQLHIYNITSGERFVTYAIRASAGSGTISVNGAAAHRAKPGDLVILCAYSQLTEAEAEKHQPSLIYVDDQNRISHAKNAIPAQAA